MAIAWGTLASISIIIAFGGGSLPATGADEALTEGGPWRIVLDQQLKAEKGCALSEVLTYHELPLGDALTVDARISCIDGREFNVSRERPHQKFKIELCQPSVC